MEASTSFQMINEECVSQAMSSYTAVGQNIQTDRVCSQQEWEYSSEHRKGFFLFNSVSPKRKKIAVKMIKLFCL